jgi:hypothetical protein
MFTPLTSATVGEFDQLLADSRHGVFCGRIDHILQRHGTIRLDRTLSERALDPHGLGPTWHYFFPDHRLGKSPEPYGEAIHSSPQCLLFGNWTVAV